MHACETRAQQLKQQVHGGEKKTQQMLKKKLKSAQKWDLRVFF